MNTDWKVATFLLANFVLFMTEV